MLNQNHSASVPVEWADVSQEISSLPELMFSGKIHTLQQSMAKDETGELKTLVESFVSETDTTAKRLIMEDILYKWADKEDVTGMRGMFDAKKLAVLEQFTGRCFQDNPNSVVINEAALICLNSAWDSLFNIMYSQLAIQTHLSGFFNALEYEFKEGGSIDMKTGGLIAYIQSQFESDTSVGSSFTKDLLKDLGLVMKQYGYQSMEGFLPFVDDMKNVFSREYQEAFVSLTGITVVEANASGNASGSVGSDILYGNASNDSLWSKEGDDILYGVNHFPIAA